MLIFKVFHKKLLKMLRLLCLILAITVVTRAAPKPQSGTAGVDNDIFNDYDEEDIFSDGDKGNDVGEGDVECDIFESDCEESPTTTTTTTTEAPTKDECKAPKPKQQFLIDLRSSDIFSANDCNKTAKCAHYFGDGFSCVPYWQCKDDESNVISDGDGLIDLREDDAEDCVHKQGTLDASDNKCEKENEVCCENSNPTVKLCPVEEPRKKVFIADTKGVKSTVSPVVTEVLPGPSTTPATPQEPITLPSLYDCGRTGSKTKLTGIKDPNAAQPGEFPHMCIVYKMIGKQRVYLGGASLIDKNKVITVAHKFYVKHGEKTKEDERENVENLLVRCGEYNVKTEAELLEYQETSVVALHINPLYQPDHKYLPNNLVILQTKENFIYQDHIGPVCLPKPEDDFKDADCWSSGWGKDSFGATGYYSDVLKKVKMPIVDHNRCEPALREELIERGKKHGISTTDFRLDESHLCIGGVPDKDTCTGDGGSPHSCKIDGKWTQVGTVAWGLGCGSEIPAIYSSIPDAMCWINHLLNCVPIAATNVEGDPDDEEDLIDLRGIGECEDGKYRSVLTSCDIYEKQQTFDTEL